MCTTHVRLQRQTELGVAAKIHALLKDLTLLNPVTSTSLSVYAIITNKHTF